MFVGLPPLGCLPVVRTLNLKQLRIGKTECVEEQNQVVVRFNEKLKSVLASLMHSVLDLKLVYVDIYEVLSDIVYNPGKFGNFF